MKDTASTKEKYELLYNVLKDEFQGIVDFEFRQSALIVLLLGWSLTSTNSRELFASSNELRITITFFVILLTSFHTLWVIHYYERSKKACDLLEELAYMPAKYFVHQKIQKWLAVSFCLIHASICLGVIIIVWLMPRLVVT